MRVLVTGSSGFIGSHVVDALLTAGHEPVCFDRRPSPYHRDARVEAVLGDILDRPALERAADGCDVIAHFAAAANVDEVRADPVGSEELNARGTLSVLEVARSAGIPRVIYASTIWVYSELVAHGAADEDTPLWPPAHLYTATKLAGEMYCYAYRTLYGLDCTVLRLGIPYGPRARAGTVVSAFVGRALDGEPLTIQGGGEQRRRFVYVEDLAAGAVCALAPCAAGRTYNLVGDTDVSIRDIAETVRDLVADVDIVHADARAGDFGGVEVSGERAAAELGWRPATGLREGIRRYVEWETARRRAEAPAAPERARRLRLRLRPPALVPVARAVALIATALVAGVLSGVLARYDAVSDGAGLLGMLALAGLPVVLVARIDWARNRRRAAVVAAAMVTGAVLASAIVSLASAVEHVVRHHPVAFLIVVLIGAAAGGYASRPATESG
jgi:UDP-glucose 4-epimerase